MNGAFLPNADLSGTNLRHTSLVGAYLGRAFLVHADLRGANLIPEAYVPDLDVRLGLYRRLSSLATKVELEGFAAEMIDRFGPLPREVNTLLLIVRIKAMCKRAGIAKLDGGPKGVTIQFHNDHFPNPQGLVEFVHDQKGQAKVRDNKIVVMRDWTKDAEKIKGAFAIARDLAQKAAPAKPSGKTASKSASKSVARGGKA